MVVGTFHVPSAIQKPLVFVATAHGMCLLLYRDSKKSQPFRAVILLVGALALVSAARNVGGGAAGRWGRWTCWSN